MSDREEAVENAVKVLSEFVNTMSHDKDGFAARVMREHRTLQQSMFALFLRTIEEWSQQEEWQHDLRNEFAVEKSKEIMKLFVGSGVPLI